MSHTNCSRILPSFAMPQRLLGASIVLNEMTITSQELCPQISEKASVLVLLRKDFPHNFLLCAIFITWT